ncbi:hypothetical protein J3369_09920 [Alteromonas sp. NFXS44]|uniref:hypothetical protein n=1 Tax=Alteromonas sp. NFXS44 TaxID=2818435 RepID=UPI0032E0563F
MDNFTIKAEYKLNGVSKTQVIKVKGNDEEHAKHLVKMRIQQHVSDRDSSSLATVDSPEIEIVSMVASKE